MRAVRGENRRISHADVTMSPRSLHHRCWCAVTALVAASACIYPTDQSGDLRVEIVNGRSQLFVGDSVFVQARVVDERGKVVGNVTIEYGSTDDAIVAIDERGRILGVSEGLAQVRAKALQLEDAPPATLPVRVFRGIEIFDVVAEQTPPDGGTVAHYGEILTLIGIGLDPANLALFQVGPVKARLIGYSPAVVTDASSRDTLRMIVPAGVDRDVDIVALGPTGATAVWPITVIRTDIYEPNDNPPDMTDLGVVSEPIELFEMALETPEDNDPSGGLFPRPFDLYRMHFDPSIEQMSIVFSATRNPKTPNELPFRLFITQSIGDVYQDGFPFDAMAPAHDFFNSMALCKGWIAELYHFWPGLDGPNRRGMRDSMIVALSEIPPGGFEEGALDITLSYSEPPTRPIPYDIRIVPEYLSDLPPDAAEENDFCGMAQGLPTNGESLALNFDHSSDVDWFRFTVTGEPRSTAPTIRDVTEMEPNGAPASADTIALGDRVTGAIDPGGDIDGFWFFADAGTVLDIDVEANDAGSDMDPVLELFDANDGFVAFNDDFGPSLDSRLIHRLPEAGWYRLVIQDFGMWCCGDPFAGGPDAPNAFYTIAVSQLASGNIGIVSMTSDAPFEGVMQFFEPPTDFGFPLVVWSCCGFPIDFDDPAGPWRHTWSDLIDPGEYLLMIHDPPGNPIEYTLTADVFAVGSANIPESIPGFNTQVPPSARTEYAAAKERRLQLTERVSSQSRRAQP